MLNSIAKLKKKNISCEKNINNLSTASNMWT